MGSGSAIARTLIVFEESRVRQDYACLLQNFSENLFARLPSEITDEEIYSLESLLNEMHYQSNKENWTSDIQDAILSALSQVSSLCYEMKQQTEKKRDIHAIKTIKQFATLFQLLAFYIQQESSINEKLIITPGR
jgi:hypothetical protein